MPDNSMNKVHVEVLRSALAGPGAALGHVARRAEEKSTLCSILLTQQMEQLEKG